MELQLADNVLMWNGSIFDASTGESHPIPKDQVADGAPVDARTIVGSATDIPSFVSKVLKQPNGKNAIIECPPGLGRQMKILEGALEYLHWKRGLNDNCSQVGSAGANVSTKPRIYFATRDFQQVELVVQKIKERFDNESNLRDIKMTVLGSKKNLCVNNEVKRRDTDEVTVEQECQRRIQSYNWNARRGLPGEQHDEHAICPYFSNNYSNLQMYSLAYPSRSQDGVFGVRDIEDLMRHGQDRNRCPFFDCSYLHSSGAGADLVICPLEILLNPVRRREYQITLKESVIIIDDGYDLEYLCYEEGSVTIKEAELRRASEALVTTATEFQRATGEQQNGIDPLVMQSLSNLAQPLRRLSQWMRDNCNAQNDERPSKDLILEELSGLPMENTDILNETLHKAWTQLRVPVSSYESFNKLKKFFTVISLVSRCPNDYVLELLESDHGARPMLKIICANAGLIFRHVEGSASSIIVGGNCLAPIGPFRSEIGVEFEDVFQVVHDTPLLPSIKERYLLSYCSKGPGGHEYTLDYKRRSNLAVKEEVFQSILHLCQVIPDGVVVLFHSRRYFGKVLSFLRQIINGTGESRLAQLELIKHVIQLNSTTPAALAEEIANYKTFSRNPRGDRKGALLLTYVRDCVIRKYNLKDEQLRGIIHVSIAFGRWHHCDIQNARRLYFEDERSNLNPPTHPDEDGGHLDWYEQEGHRVTNQAFGQCVQDQQDWGVVVVLDNRMPYGWEQSYKDRLPAWVSHLDLFKHSPFNKLFENIQTFVLSRNAEV